MDVTLLPQVGWAVRRLGPRAGCRTWFDRDRGATPKACTKDPGSDEEALDMRVCVPITADGQVDPRWGRADRVAVADVADGEIRDWQEFTVAWGTLHDQGTEGAHHARVARSLQDNQVQAIAVGHVGPGMQRIDRKSTR